MSLHNGNEHKHSIKRRRMRTALCALGVALLAAAFYADPVTLHGELVYDDKGSILWNPVVKCVGGAAAGGARAVPDVAR